MLFSLLVTVIAFSASETEVKTQSTNLLLPEEVEQYNSINRSSDEFDLSGADINSTKERKTQVIEKQSK